MNKYPSELTPEIAFRIGAVDYPCFYDMARWEPNLEDFPLYHFFLWGYPRRCSKTGNDNDWQVSFTGYVDYDKFNTVELKHAYIKGRLSAYSVTIKEDSILVTWANSYKSREKFKEYIRDILFNKFGFWGVFIIEESEKVGTIPGTPNLTIRADKDIINFICK